MYCLSQFCCLCFRNKAKLKLLHDTTCEDLPFIEVTNVEMPEIQLSEYSHGLSVCEVCVNFVAEIRTFRRNCVRNNHVLVEHIELLGSFGGKIGNAQQNVNREAFNEEDWIGTERVEEEDCYFDVSSNLAGLHCDETSISDNRTFEEEVKYQIEVNDDLNDAYGCKEEMYNHDQLEQFVAPQHTIEFQAVPCVSHDDNELQHAIKIERVHNENPECGVSSNLARLQCNETAISENLEEGFECKIEINDEFNDKFERNDDHLDELLDDPLYSPAPPLQISADDASPIPPNISEDNDLDFMKYCEENTFYRCKICRKSLKTVKFFKRHVSNHNKKRTTHKCETCGKCFDFLSYLKNHALVHSGEKPHRCATCGQCFNLLGTLKKHVMIHTGEKPYGCDVCGECFRGQNDLKRHRLVHTGEKPYKCGFCEKNFRLATLLNQHVRIHTGETPYECNVCERRFHLASQLKRHEANHFDAKPHKCDMCEKSYTRGENLRSHKMKHHCAENIFL